MRRLFGFLANLIFSRNLNSTATAFEVAGEGHSRHREATFCSPASLFTCIHKTGHNTKSLKSSSFKTMFLLLSMQSVGSNMEGRKKSEVQDYCEILQNFLLGILPDPSG